ncbi:MAG: DNA (cytosine-5-)-methyltransferase [Spongiibacter sp.]|nr:DNA (cytosine-5-)-methyltransferase [Spongiibacter sp.]
MKYLSVCSGIEAASVAWEPLGFEPFAFSEIDKFPAAVLAHHWPAVPNLGDMTRFKEWPNANVDVFVGGTPCQSFSVAGLRKGLDDPRGNLMLTYGAIAAKYRPKWLVWENVPGVLSSNGGRDFGTFLGMLGELGYGFAYRVLDAQYFGVAQRRRRVFVVGCLGDWRSAAAVLFERHSLSGHPAPRREKGQDFTAHVAPSLTNNGRGVERTRESSGQDPVVAWPAEVAPTLNAHFGDKLGLENQHALGGGGGCSCQPVANPLTARMHKGMNTTLDEGQTPIVTFGGAFDDGIPEVTHSLRGEGFDASEDGTGRGTPIVLHGTQDPCVSDKAFALGRNNDAENVLAIQNATRGKSQNGLGISTDGAMYTLDNASQHGVAVPILEPGARTGKSTTDTDIRAGIGVGEDGDPMYTLQAGKQHGVCFAQNTRDELREMPYAGALSANAGMKQTSYVRESMSVRRLTPRECERLQGFPDGHTLIPYRNKPADQCPDGPRYKALGNSMAVPVMRWIGKRILEVEAIA